jgi:hypothetical protein
MIDDEGEGNKNKDKEKHVVARIALHGEVDIELC